MSAKHPIIAVTGSSGAGTTSVMRTFEQIFRRENIQAGFVEGDSFHRYNRAEMKQQMADAIERGDHHFSHFGPDANLLSRGPKLGRWHGCCSSVTVQATSVGKEATKGRKGFRTSKGIRIRRHGSGRQ